MSVFSGKVSGRRVKVRELPGYGWVPERYSIGEDGVVYSGGMPLAAIGGVGVNLGGRRVRIAELVRLAFGGEEEERVRRGRKCEERLVRAIGDDGEVVGMWRSVREASEATGVSEDGIRAALRGERKRSGGFLWV